MIKDAIFSDCRKYRYTLRRIWDESKPYAMFICLNPSTADETKNDPTVRRCINYSRDWGYGGFVMMNLFAFRATDPKIMKACPKPIGPDNTYWIEKMAEKAGIIVAAWGVHGAFQARHTAMLTLPILKDKIHYLELTNSKQPKHPLYLKKNLKPKLYKGD